MIFCYELMQDYMDIYADNLPAAALPPPGKKKKR